jgi:hypothetical protein
MTSAKKPYGNRPFLLNVKNLSEVSMELIIVLLVLLAIMAAFVVNRFVHHGNPFPFHKKTQLFTHVERSFLQLLERAVGGKYKIINRVKLADILELKENADSKTRRTAMLKMNAKYLDYVLCNTDDMSIVAVIDLVNNANREGHKATPDWFVSGALEASGIPYIRMKIKAGYTVADIQQGLAAKLGNIPMAAPPVVKGTVKKGPTRPVRPLTSNVPSQALKQNTTALVQIG